MIYASVCDGIGAAHVVWNPLGWRCAWTSEISAFPAAVVEHRWGLPNLGDMTKIGRAQTDEHGPVDLLVGGTPCQSFSVAGLRRGLADPRGNLALVYLGLADLLRPRWLVWENVPGVLSSSGGRDFGAFLGGLAELGYGFAYRVLDAQYVRVQSHPRAVPQRRRRVFVVGHLGDWRPAAQVLLERQSLCGHPAPRRAPGEGLAADAAPSLVSSGRGVERTGETRGQDPVVAIQERAGADKGGPGGKGYSDSGAAYTIEARSKVQAVAMGFRHWASASDSGQAQTECSPSLRSADTQGSAVAHTLRGAGADAGEDGTGRGIPLVAGFDRAKISNPDNRSRVDAALAQPTLSGSGEPCVAADLYNLAEGPVAPTMNAAAGGGQNRCGVPHTRSGLIVRRLTPRECERLQGFPDDYTLVPFGPRGRLAKDSPRYTALGNSMAVNVMAWIGRRIAWVDEGLQIREAATA